MKDAVIVRGTPAPTGPADDLGRHLVDLGLGEAVETAPGAPSAYPREPRPTSMKGVFVELETWFAVPVIDEVGLDAYGVMMKQWIGDTKGKPNAAWMNTTLASLMKQTGLEFAVEKRERDVWEVTEEK
jgi:hypothetical protein